MLKSLHIKNYILIDSLEVDFPEGLVIITGQTGAGKSILMGALGLVSGAKSDASHISEGADSCVVEAVFGTDDTEVRSIIESNDLDWEDGELTIRRQISRSGRSRAFVNDTPVPVGVLQSLSARLIDIHSQHCSLLLADSAYQLSVLDSYAGNAKLLDSCAAIWTSLRQKDREISELKAKRDSMLSDAEYKRNEWLQLDQAKLQSGELESLEEEQKQLANAEEIKSALASVSLHADGDGEENGGIIASLRDMRRELEKLQKYIPEAGTLAQRVESARIEIEDISSEVESIDASISVSPSRLEFVEDRMSMLYELMRRHSVSDIDALIAIRDSLSESLVDSDTISERISRSEKERAEIYDEYKRLSGALRRRRQEASVGMSERITSSLHFLELESAEFVVSVTEGAEGMKGADNVSFLFSSNGTQPQDVKKCASGGEMSRIMLCIKAMMAEYASMPTLIFDEIDTGVSGSVADKMGRMICSMGENMQVFAITHLPQVAAKGRAHYLVSKSANDSGRNVSGIVELGKQERISEIARMLSGSEITEAAIANAKSLLGV